MKTIFLSIKAVGVFLLWVVYFFLSINSRQRYSLGKIKKMHCIQAKNDALGTDGVFLPGVEPYREYATFKQFFSRFGFYGKND